MIGALMRPWPWYVAGPLIGLFVPLLLLLGNRQFGVSSSLRAICAAALPSRAEFFRYDWKSTGAWSLAFVGGIALGGALATKLFVTGTPEIAASTRDALAALGILNVSGLAPAEVFSWASLVTVRGVVCMVGGGFLVGFGTAYAGGCTSGHGITGLATWQLPSLVAVVAFFIGGLFTTFVILPHLL